MYDEMAVRVTLTTGTSLICGMFCLFFIQEHFFANFSFKKISCYSVHSPHGGNICVVSKVVFT